MAGVSLECPGGAGLDSQTSHNLTELEAAEKDLRFYTAIIGHRPTVDPNAPDNVEPAEVEAIDPPDTIPFPVDFIEMPPPVHCPNRLSLWIRNLSAEARKRLDEARHRIAS